MAEAEQGTIIKDLGKSLPMLEDFFYNDLEGYDTEMLPDQKGAEKILFYQENPPQSADYLGVSPDGSLLTLKVPKEAFNITIPGVISNSVSGNSIRVDLSKAEYDGYDNVKAILEQFKADPQLAGYYAKLGADNEDLFNRNRMAFAASLRLLYTNLPSIPKFTSTEVMQDKIVELEYQEVKDKKNQYHFCTVPYPYVISYREENNGRRIATCTNYKDAHAENKTEYDNADKISFIKDGNIWKQVIPLDKTSAYVCNVLVLEEDNTVKEKAVRGYIGKNTMIREIENAKDIRLVLDINSLANTASASTYLMKYPLDYTDHSPSGNFTNYIKDLANNIFDHGWYKYAGYIPYGLDKYHRIGGVIYVQKEVTSPLTGKKELVWYNLNKQMIAEANNPESPLADSVTSPTDRYHVEYGPAALKPYTYNYANRCYVDRFWREAGENENNRLEAQKQIFASTNGMTQLFPSGKDDEYKTDEAVLYKWTVSLGDVTFFVPPESIRVVSQTDTVRVPIMRARGTIAKGRERSMQYLEMNLFFNEDRGINGQPYTVDAPNKETKFTYYMNGFRALLAQMKFTPFLPIINKYINEDLGIYAVCIENLDVSTVPGFPKLLKARILLSKFNYQVYMPEIPQPENDSKVSLEKRNPFSACIDYDTMRWYYQRCIMLGDELDRLLNIEDKAKRITVNSLEFYMRTIFANRTALLPCHFMDPNISVYIADEDHLKTLLQIKQDAMKKSLNVSDNYNPTENEARLIREADQLYTNVNISGIYVKHMEAAGQLLPTIERAVVSGKKESADCGNNGHVDVKYPYVIYKNKQYNVNSIIDTNAFLNAFFYIPILEEYQKMTKTLRNEMEEPLVSNIEIDQEEESIKLQMNVSYLPAMDRKNTTRESSVYLKKQGSILSIDPEKIFNNAQIVLKIVYAEDNLEQSGSFLQTALANINSLYRPDFTIAPASDKYASLSFLEWCHTTGKGVVDANDEASRLKQSIDYEDIHTLKYNLILENALVTQFQASVGNTYARIGVTGVDGSAPQYMGGQDTHLSWTIETKDEIIASTFKSLPELTAYYTRVYRRVLPTYPIKIDSEFTRMMGVQEITLDNVVVSTVEGFPGLYRIVVNATSVDRTLRNKEAFKLLELKGQTQGLEDSRKKTQVNIRYFKDLERSFSEAEVYPDLELPKISELGKLGWRYIRYRAKERNNEEFYVDPDFYFVYPNLTVGRAIIESLRCTFDEKLRNEVSEDDITQLLTDTSGVQRVVRKNGGIDRKVMNSAAEEDLEDQQVQVVNAVKQDRVYYIDRIKSTVMRMPFGSFDIGNKIRCVFTEPYYIKECKWAKNEIDMPKEKILEIQVKDMKQSTLDEAAKTAGPDFAQIRFVLQGAKGKDREVTVKSNPNYNSKEQTKIKDIFTNFETCAKELETYLTDNDDSLSSAVIVENDPGSTETDTGKTKSVIFSTDEYGPSLIIDYLNNSGFWTITKKYGIFNRTNISEEITEENARNFIKNGEVYLDKASEEQSGAIDTVAFIIQAVADALSAKEECSAKNKTKGFGRKSWQADMSQPYVINDGTVCHTLEDVKKPNAKSFGVFCIRKYKFQELMRILPKEERQKLVEEDATKQHSYYVLDPYFRYQDKETKDAYLQHCATSSSFCATAFLRIIVWYMAKLIRYHIIPSVEFDVKRQENINAADASEAANNFLKQQGIAAQQTSTLFTELKAFAKNNGQAFDAGKFFAAALLALTEEGFDSNTIFDMYDMRNYDELNHLIQAVTSVKYKSRNENDPTYLNRNPRIRKFLLALYGYGIIEDPNNINKNVQASPANRFLTSFNTKIALEACSNPVQYMRDSFYDAVRNDYRGRMLRAFPTFYMVFADEGREVGLWKLHDNFYNFNAIHEIQIVKSRKIAADTCKIILSNMFQTFTTNDEDCTINYKGNFGDLWDSFLNPRDEMEREELKRLAAKKVNRAKLQTGVRIHVRMGYGANAADLPCCFNGVIADIKPGELVEVVAQGDGVELCNPIFMENDADTVQNNDNFATMDKCVCGAPPKDILQGFLTAKGGPMAAWLRNQYRNGFFGTGWSEISKANYLAERNQQEGYASSIFDQDGFIMYGLLNIFNNNPYGIRHFGDPSYRKIFAQGEPAQNLYEITNRDESIWSDDIENKVYFGDGAFDLDDELNGWSGYNDHNNLPYISFKPYGKTIWEIMHICKSIEPDYMTGIADFQFRSTVFLGKPHYYYAYKYARDGSGNWYEKRKPFQQWHLYNNFSDIVENKISASSEKMKTTATGVYEVECLSGMKKTAPMWVDQDIYPEYQKSMVVDTKLYGKSWIKHNAIMGTLGAIPVLGWATDLIADGVAQITNYLMDEHCATLFDKRGSVESHSRIAEDAVIDALKNSVKEMYQGYMIVLGDPSVKPNDRIQITDAYEDMSGLCDVREVIHTLSAQTGFTTTITPDAISAHNLKNEIIKNDIAAQVLARVGTGLALAISGAVIGPRLYAQGAKVISDSKTLAMTKTIGKEGIKDVKSLVSWIKELNLSKAISEVTEEAITELADTKTGKVAKVVSNITKQGTKTSANVTKAGLSNILQKIGVFISKHPNALKAISGATAADIVVGAGAAGTAAAGTAAASAVVIPALVAAGAMEIIGSTFNSALLRTIKGLQTLYIFPLRKFGKALTAGLDGQQGLVYGTIQFNTPGPIEQLVGKYLSHSKGDYAIIKNAIRGIFIDERVMELADKWDKEENDEFIKAARTENETMLDEAELQSVGGAQLDKALYQPNSAYMLSLMPRTMVDGIQSKWAPTIDQKQETIWQAVRNRYYIDNIKDWMVNPNIRNLIYLEDNLSLKPFFLSGFLRTLPQAILSSEQYQDFNKDNILEFPIHMPKGEFKQVIGVKRLEDQKTGKTVVLDLPYASLEGVTILKEICNIIQRNTPYLTQPDARENNQQNKDTSIIISSALVAGSAHPLYGSGFHLILTGTGELGKDGVLEKYIKQYYDRLQEQLKPSSDNYEHLPLFEIDKGMSKKNEVGISIGVPSPFHNNIATKQKNIGKLTNALTVIKVIDGDTLVVKMEDGKEVSIRLLSVDTPESVHADPSKNVPEGKVASNYVKYLLEGKQVQLEFDQNIYDKHGRTLAYVYYNGKMVQETLVEQGLASVLIVPPNNAYADKLKVLQEIAKKNKVGFWGEKSSYFANGGARQ